MSKMEFTDYALRCAATEYREAMLSVLPRPSECEHEFTAEYCEKRDALIRKTERRSSMRRVCKNAAAVFLVCFLGAGAFLGINGEARADFLRWARDIYENSIIYRYAGESEAPLPECELTWIPEGYELVLSDRDENSMAMVYENENGDVIVFSCNRMTENSLVQMITIGEGESKKVNVNGMDGELFVDTGTGVNNLIWMNDNLGVVYSIDGTVNEIVIMHMAESLKTAK